MTSEESDVIDKDKVKGFFQKFDWKTALFIVVLLIYGVLVINLALQFKQLPSPLYGGDYYHSMGTVEHFKAGGSPFKNAALLNGLPSYFPVYTILAGGIAKVFSLDSFVAMRIFSMIEIFLSVIVVYFLGKLLFKNKITALIFAVAYLDLTFFPVWKYLQFTQSLMFPLFFLAAFYFYEKRNWVSAVILGLVYGTLGITHSVGFVTASMFMIIFSLYLLIFQHMKKFKMIYNKDFKENFVKTLRFLIIVAVLGVAIAMLYWYKPIFVFHGQPLNPVPNFDQQDFSSMRVWWSFTVRIFTMYFFNFSNLYYAIKSIFFILGIIGIFFLKKYTNAHRFIIIMLITTLIGSFHFIILQPITGINLSAEYISMFAFALAIAMFTAFTASTIGSFAKKYSDYVLIIFFALLLLFNIMQFTNYASTDRWIQVGKSPVPQSMIEMKNWVLANTGVNDIFLSNNELSFALNALTGRKLLTLKRGHTELFSDANKNMQDAAIIFFSNSTDARKALLKDRNVKYLYWQADWVRLEYQFDEQGKLVSIFDPLLLLDTPETRKLLEENNISYTPDYTWLDPAVRQDDVKKFNVLYIGPQNYNNYTNPWKPDLDNFLQEVWSYTDPSNNMAVARIYKIVNIT